MFSNRLLLLRFSKSPPPMKRRRKSRAKLDELDQSATIPADFSFSLTSIAVSQICQSVGYRATDSSALNTLTLITTKFFQSLARLAVSYSNTANRTEVNLFDIVNGLQDISLSTSDCFPGGSTLHDTESHCLIKSAVLRNLSDFVTYAPEIPFAKPLPKQQIDGDLTRKHQAPSSTRSLTMNSVPAWLPPFPYHSLDSERCTKDRSNHLWGNFNSVLDHEILPDGSKAERLRGRSGGRLPERRDKVIFKVRRDLINSGESCDVRRERWRDNKDDGLGDDIDVKKKNKEEFIYSGCIAAGYWPI